MSSRWFNVTVGLFWLATMTWLIGQKILPALMLGDPPTYLAVVGKADEPSIPVGWEIKLNDAPVGWATGLIEHYPQGGHDIRGRVHLVRLPLGTMTPAWMNSFVRLIQRAGDLPDIHLELDANNSLGIDPLGRPSRFHSLATVGYSGRQPRSGRQTFNIRVDGAVEGSYLRFVLRSGDFSYSTNLYLPMDSLMGDALSPQGRLPNLRVGQTWTVPSYSPFRPPSSPLEILQAHVEREETFAWQGRPQRTLVVVLRNDPGAELSNRAVVRGHTWVATDGTVLKNELELSGAKLTFERMPDPPQSNDNSDPRLRDRLQPWWDVEATP